MMLQEIGLWTQKLQQGYSVAKEFCKQQKTFLAQDIKKIAFVGMGGSGIAGRIIQTLLSRQCGLPVIIVDSCQVPLTIDKETLTIVMSYSGNTWETLMAFEQLVIQDSPIIAMSHGGLLRDRALALGLPFVQAPTSLTPRSSLGSSLGFLCGLFDYMKLMKGEQTFELFCRIADKLVDRYSIESSIEPFIYAVDARDSFYLWGISGYTDAVAYRAQTQFNENSKIPVICNYFPELCHNFLVGFSSVMNRPLIITFTVNEVHETLKKALDVTTGLLEERGVSLYKPPLLGDTFEEQLLALIIWADYASYYLARIRGIDAQPVLIIDELKKRHQQNNIGN